MLKNLYFGSALNIQEIFLAYIVVTVILHIHNYPDSKRNRKTKLPKFTILARVPAIALIAV